ncbi:MAG: ATP-dependent helicase HrpB, partial [Brevundimonas sp.]
MNEQPGRIATRADAGDADLGARIAALLSEPGLGGSSVDLSERLKGLERDRTPRARDAGKLIDRWAAAARKGAVKGSRGADVGVLLAEAFPERVAKARGKPGEYLLSSARGAFLDATDPLAREPWLAIAELGGGEARDRIRLAAPVDPADLEHRLEVEDRLSKEPSGRLVLKRLRRIGAIVVDEKLMGAPDRAAITAALQTEVEAEGLKALNWGERASALRARLAFVGGLEEGWPDVSDDGLMAERELWLWPLLDGVQSLGALNDAAPWAFIRSALARESRQPWRPGQW